MQGGLRDRAAGLLRDQDSRIVLYLILFTLGFRLLTLMMIHTGVDERDYWFSAKRLLLGLPYDNIQHRTIRFAVILPVLAAQALLGTDPAVYYVVPLLLSLLQVALIYRVALSLYGRLVAFVAAVMLALFPYMIRGGSQIRPDIFSLTYVLASLFFFLKYLCEERRRTQRLLLSAALLFVAYQAKISNIYFAPGFLLSILLVRRSRRDALVFAGLLLALYAVEHALLYRLSGDPLGQIGIIVHNHFQGDYIAPMTFWGLFGRYSPEKLPWYWMAVLLLAAVAVIRHFWTGDRDPVRATLVYLTTCFLLGMTFVVKSLRPVIPVEPFIHRYLLAVLGPVLLLDAPLLMDLWRRLAGRTVPQIRPRTCGLVLVLGLAVTAAAFSLPVLPAGLRAYANNPLRPSGHTLSLVHRYREVVSDAFDRGTPVVGTDDLAGRNALDTCAQFFVSDDALKTAGLPRLGQAAMDGRQIAILARGPVTADGFGDPNAAVVAVRRNPLRVVRTVASLAPALIREDSRSREE